MPPAQPNATIGARQGRRQEVVRRLLVEGLGLMTRRGIQACRVEEIIAAAGGWTRAHSSPTSPPRSPSWPPWVEQALDDLARRVRPLGLGRSGSESLLAGVGTAHLRYFQLRPETASLLTQACGLDQDSPAGQQVSQRLSAHLDLVAGLLAPAAGQMGWPAEPGRELALSCGFFWFGRPLDLVRRD